MLRNKKILLILLILFSTLLNGENLQSFLSIATFNSQDGPYLETYLSINANTVKLVKSFNKYIGELNVEIEIFNNENIYFKDNYILTSPEFIDSINNNIFFIDQQRIPLKEGNYNLKLKIFDIHNKFEISHTKSIEIEYSSLSISDIQLLEKYSLTKNNNFLEKSGYTLYPYVSNFYPKEIDSITFYFEIYNTTILKKYLINTYIEKFENQEVFSDFDKSLRKTSSLTECNLLSYNISTLPTGNYNLVCEVKDSSNNVLKTKKIFFQRSNNYINQKYAASTFSNFTNSISNDSIIQFIDYLYPISTNDENTYAQNQLKYNDLDKMRNFFFSFWYERNNINPSIAWENYYKEIKKVNKAFKNGIIKGYLTDRGRVYLQYGPPNSRNKIDNASSTYPYEIWHYYKLKNQNDKKFVFVNSDLATNEYKLEYSNVLGEVSNSEWRDRIDQDNNPTFGDDFNNNYINPK